MPTAHHSLRLAATALTVALLAACGGGGGDDPPVATPTQPAAQSAAGPITRVVVAGDSLADSGTFGYRATVATAANPATGYPVFTELVARELNVTALCPAFTSSDRGQNFSRRTGCTNYAVAGGLVNNPVVRSGDDSPFSIPYQLRTALQANGGAWGAGDLLLVDGGANDIAGLADTYIDQLSSGSDRAVLLALLGQELSASTIADALSQSNGGLVAGRLYAQATAQTFWNALRTNALDRGATRVAVLEVPDLTRTPRFRSILQGLATTQGAGIAAETETGIRDWVTAYNAELARLAAGNARVAIVPYAADFQAQNANPARYGLTVVAQPACPSALDFPTCTDNALDAAPPAGGTAGWWRTWLYSDNFHPSPRGHELIARLVQQTLVRAGWR
jgi:phospholipase/lecithinase/hemolysin